MKKSTFVNTIKMDIFYSFIIRIMRINNYPGLFRILMYLLIVSWMSLTITSCKTCKCPAYSKIESQNPAIAGIIDVKTSYFF